jgi:hypothetical protein
MSAGPAARTTWPSGIAGTVCTARLCGIGIEYW